MPSFPTSDDNSLYSNRTQTTQNGEPPPRVDRTSKPTRFRSAHERLFGRPDPRDSIAAPDYINTSAALPQLQSPVKKNDSLERSTAIPNGRTGFMDTSSFSSDSYTKYSSPTATLDDRRYDSLTSGNSTFASPNNANRIHDPYRFTRSTAQPVGMNPNKQPVPCERNAKLPTQLPPNLNKFHNEQPNVRNGPPSPPPKPSNYQSM